MTKAKEGQPFSNGIPPNYHPFCSDRFVMIILFFSQSSFILSPTQNPSVCNHCPSNLICGIVLSDLLIFPYTDHIQLECVQFFVRVNVHNNITILFVQYIKQPVLKIFKFHFFCSLPVFYSVVIRTLSQNQFYMDN